MFSRLFHSGSLSLVRLIKRKNKFKRLSWKHKFKKKKRGRSWSFSRSHFRAFINRNQSEVSGFFSSQINNVKIRYPTMWIPFKSHLIVCQRFFSGFLNLKFIFFLLNWHLSILWLFIYLIVCCLLNADPEKLPVNFSAMSTGTFNDKCDVSWQAD